MTKPEAAALKFVDETIKEYPDAFGVVVVLAAPKAKGYSLHLTVRNRVVRKLRTVSRSELVGVLVLQALGAAIVGVGVQDDPLVHRMLDEAVDVLGDAGDEYGQFTERIQ